MFNIDTGEHYLPVTLKWLENGAKVIFKDIVIMQISEEELKKYDIYRPAPPKKYEIMCEDRQGYKLYAPNGIDIGYFNYLVDAKRVCDLLNKEEGL